jgi:hypothetical protein
MTSAYFVQFILEKGIHLYLGFIKEASVKTEHESGLETENSLFYFSASMQHFSIILIGLKS